MSTDGEFHRAPGAEGSEHRGRARRLDADDPGGAAPSAAEPAATPRNESTAADRHEDGARVGHLLGQLEADRPLPGDHEGVVEGRHVECASLGRIARAACSALSTTPASKRTSAPYPRVASILGSDAAAGMKIVERNAAERSRQSHALGVVAGRGGHYFLGGSSERREWRSC